MCLAGGGGWEWLSLLLFLSYRRHWVLAPFLLAVGNEFVIVEDRDVGTDGGKPFLTQGLAHHVTTGF